MKKYVSIIAIMLCTLTINVKALDKGDKLNKATTECSCCKNCKDEKCKELCTKWCSMTADEQKSADGKKVKEECIKICKEKKCCSPDGTCEGMEGKNCCKKK